MNRWPPARPLLPPVPGLVRVGVSGRGQTLVQTFVYLIAPNRFGSDAVIDFGRLPARSSRSFNGLLYFILVELAECRSQIQKNILILITKI